MPQTNAKGRALGPFILALILGLACVGLALLAWADYAEQLAYQDISDSATNGKIWVFGFHVCSALFCLYLAVGFLRGSKAWQLVALVIVFLLNLGLVMMQFLNFFSGWGGSSLG